MTFVKYATIKSRSRKYSYESRPVFSAVNVRDIRKKKNEKNNNTGTGKAKLFLCLTNYALRHEDVLGSGCIGPHILGFGASWRWVVSFTSQPLCTTVKGPPPPLTGIHWIGGWVGPRVGLDDSDGKYLACPGTRAQTPRSSST
jgi:hypothetical protein